MKKWQQWAKRHRTLTVEDLSRVGVWKFTDNDYSEIILLFCRYARIMVCSVISAKGRGPPDYTFWKNDSLVMKNICLWTIRHRAKKKRRFTAFQTENIDFLSYPNGQSPKMWSPPSDSCSEGMMSAKGSITKYLRLLFIMELQLSKNIYIFFISYCFVISSRYLFNIKIPRTNYLLKEYF